MGDELKDVLKQLGKKYGPHTILDPEILKKMKVERVSTGSLSLDLEMGGGWPLGRVVEIYGRESSGKTMMALKAAVEVQKLGKPVVWVDVEKAFDSEWATTLGVDLNNIDVIQPNTGEEAADFIDAVTRTGECGLVVLDSIAAMLPALDEETPMTQVEKLGNKAVMVNRMIRKLHSAINVRAEDGSLNNCLILLINQVREKIGVLYGNPTTTPGGLGLKFASSIILELRSGEWIEEEQNGENIKIGRRFKFRTEKNKTYPPYRSSVIPFYFAGTSPGIIDNAESLASYLLLLNLITKKGSFYAVDEETTVQGKKGLLNYLRDKKVYNKWEKQVRELYLKK